MLNRRDVLAASLLASIVPAFGQSAPGALDRAFVPALPSQTWARVAVQNDDKIVVLAGGILETLDQYIWRLNADGSQDSSFAPPSIPFEPAQGNALAFQEGRILLGVVPSPFGPEAGGLLRLKENGGVDGLFQRPHFPTGSSIPAINALVVLPDQSIMVGGNFASVDGFSMPGIARLLSDGSLDRSFQSSLDSSERPLVHSILAESGGARIVAGGVGLESDRTSIRNLLVFAANGSLQGVLDVPPNFNRLRQAVILAQDRAGRRLVASADEALEPLARFLENGLPDPAFDIGSGPNNSIAAIALDAKGRILVCGPFTVWSGHPRRQVARLLENGALDETFGGPSELNGAISSIALQGTDRLLIGGSFTRIDGEPRPGLARLYAGDAALEEPSAPSIVMEPQPLSVEEGDNASFRVEAKGSPLFFHWLKNGAPIPGATNAHLLDFGVMSNAFYSVTVSNALGQATSDPAALEVTPNRAGTNLVLNPSVEIPGTEPIDFSRPSPISRWQSWGATFAPPPTVFTYPFHAPFSPRGYQYPLHGSNFVLVAGTAASGRFAEPLGPGRYEIEIWVARVIVPAVSNRVINLRLADTIGSPEFPVASQNIALSSNWHRIRRTVLTTRPSPYTRLFLSSSEMFIDKVSVIEVPPAGPVLAALPPQQAVPLQEFRVTNTIAIADAIDAPVTFSLAGAVPDQMTIDPRSGIVRWTPSLSHAGTTNQVTVKASFAGSEQFGDTTIVTIVVPDVLSLDLGEARLPAGTNGAVSILLNSYSATGVGVARITAELRFPPGRIENLSLANLNPALDEAAVTPLDDSTARVVLSARDGQFISGRGTRLADLLFDAPTGQSSAFFLIDAAGDSASRIDGQAVSFIAGHPGRIGIAGSDAMLESARASLKLYGSVGARIALETTASLSPPIDWQHFGDIVLTNFVHEIPGLPTNSLTLFLRARQIP